MAPVPAASAHRLPSPGDRVDRYQVVSEIAAGGMAAVYAVRRATAGLDKLFAMKVMLPHLASEQRFVDMFIDEVKIASQLQHPNIVQIFDVGRHGELPFFVMEYLHGRSLTQVLRRASESGQRVPVDVALSVLAAAATGLHAAHEAKTPTGEPLGIVHRDVSPQNIHVGYDGQVKVVDFGVASAAGRVTSTRTGEIKGKLAYVSPERFIPSHPIERATDVWALGTVAWETLAARPLFTDRDEPTTLWNVMNLKVPALDAALPARVAATVMACLEREPVRRLSSCAELATQLRLASGPEPELATARFMRGLFTADEAAEREQLASSQSKITQLATVAAPPRSGRVLGYGAAAIALALAALAFVWFTRPPAPVLGAPSPPAVVVVTPPALAPEPGLPPATAAPAAAPAAKTATAHRRHTTAGKAKAEAAPEPAPAQAPPAPTPSGPLLGSPYR